MTTSREPMTPRAASDFLSGGGEMGEMIRSIDWAQTPLGPVEAWPQSLRTAISIMLASRFAMVVAWGPEFRFFYNDRYRPVLGASKHPGALGTPAKEIFPEAWPFIGPLFESTRQGESVALEDVLIPLDRYGYLENCHFTLSYSPIRDESGGVGGMLAVVAETTERVEGERRLRTLRELAQRPTGARTVEEACKSVAEALGENPIDAPFSLFYLVDADGTRARLAATVGLPAGTQASPTTVDLAHDSDNGWPLASVASSRKPRVVENLAMRFGALPGGPYPELTHTAVVTPMRRPDQKHSDGLIVFGISPRRALDERYMTFIELAADQTLTAIRNARAYEDERKRAEALAELDRAKTDFFSNVSHEFRTPLALMLGPLEDLLQKADGSLSPQQRGQLDVAHRNSLRLLKLVNTLLDFSRIEAGRIQASYNPTDLASYTAELASVFRSAVERAGLRFVINCPPLEKPVYIDREMWEKIVLNLLSNAFKFTFQGEIEVSLRQVGERVELAVRDTGTGISTDELPHVFERFHRVKGARGRTFEGSGIGLALVQELVKLHGGTVRVESEFEHGSTFIVSIPLGKTHLPADRLHQPQEAQALASAGVWGETYIEETLRWLPETASGKLKFVADSAIDVTQEQYQTEVPQTPSARILLADDNADMREYVGRLLSQKYEVVAVGDGMSALQMARKHNPNLILTDVMMPNLDGFGLLRELRADERLKTIPVILLSARAGEESRIEGLEAGADDYLIKPFSARELLARVESHLKLQGLRRQWEEALRASQWKFSAAFEQSPLALTITSLDDGRLMEVNDSFVRLSGYTREEALGRTPEELKLWINPKQHLNGLAQLRAGQSIYGVEAHFRTKNGEERIGMIGASLIEIDSRPHVVSSVADITERKQAENRLALLADISELTRNLENPSELLVAVTQAVGEHLQVRRCLFNEIDLEQDLEMIHRDYCRGVESVAGVHRLSDYSPIASAEMQAGKTVVNRDSQIDPRTAEFYERIYALTGERAYVAVPLMRNGRWVASLWVSDDCPRGWSEQEVSLLEAVAERTWLAVEKLRSECALRESQTHLQLTTEAAQVGTWRWDIKSGELFWSDIHKKMWGYAPLSGPIYYEAWARLLDIDDLKRSELAIEKCLQGQEEYNVEYRIMPRGTTEIRWIRSMGRAVYNEAGEAVSMQGVSFDITERKRSEEERDALLLREREAREEAETLNEVSLTLAGELDLQKLVQSITDAGTKLTGAEFGAFFYNLINGQDESYVLFTLSGAPREAFEKFGLPRNTAIFDHTFRGTGIVRSDDILQHLDYGKNPPHHGMPHGHLPVRSYLAVPVISRSGEVLGGLFFGHPDPCVFSERDERIIAGIAGQAAIAIDNAQLFTEAQNEIAQRKEAEDALRETDRRKDEFLAMLAHELRNPLAPIRNAAQVLKMVGPADDNQRLAREVIERQTQQLTRLVDDLLDVSRITRGKVALQREPLELATIINRAVETSRPLIDARKHLLTLTLPAEPINVEGDLTRLVQVIGNLLNNAAKYTEDGGHIQLVAAQEDDQAVIRVRDNGMGLSADLIPHIFDLFTQADRSLDRSQGGLGIGLTLVRNLVEMHGGKVEAKSKGAGQGSEFTIWLPAMQVAKRRAKNKDKPATPLSNPQTPRLRVLIVEDKQDSAEMMAFILKHKGHEVRLSHNGSEALEAATAFRPHVVICDIGLPGMNGFEVAARLREQSEFAQTMLIAFSGYGQQEDRHRATVAGFDHYLVKPVEPDALIALLNSLQPDQKGSGQSD